MKLAWVATMGICAFASIANATLPPPPPPHDATRARCAIERFVDAINRHDLASVSSTRIIAGDVGQVSDKTTDEFFNSFDVGSKLSNGDPLLVKEVSVLELDGVAPIYLAQIQRKYSEKSYWSVWIFQFESNKLILARRADELWRLLERGSFAFAPCEPSNG